jgi:hypothetical protein
VNAPQPGRIAQQRPGAAAVQPATVPARREPPPVPAGVNAPQPGRVARQRPGAAAVQPASVPARREPPPVPAGVNAPQPGRTAQQRPGAAAVQPATVPARREPPPVPAGVNAPQPGRTAQQRPGAASAQPAPAAPHCKPSRLPAGAHAPHPGSGTGQRPAVAPARTTAAGAAPRFVETAAQRTLQPAPSCGRAALQPYKILGSDKIYGRMPATRPWFGYPYAVVNDARFIAQEIRGGMNDGDEFLQGPGGMTTFVKKHSMLGLSLRVSDDGNMAIEDSDLTDRQPKTFYATQALLQSSNQTLNNIGAGVELKQGKKTVTILTGWYSTKTLVEVYPRFAKSIRHKYNDLNMIVAPQNCDAIAESVTGIFNIGGRGGEAAMVTANRFLNSGDDYAQIGNTEARTYVDYQSLRPGRLRSLRANRFAAPDIGDAYMIGTLGDPSAYLAGGRVRIKDYASDEDRVLGWAFHFGAVVVRSGSDTITLENYARGDNRKNAPDPRWYFQMYGQQSGQSFHEFHAAKKEYANPITVNVRNPKNQPLPQLPRPGPLWYPAGETVMGIA